jgi:RHS repeat-associated protein
MKRTVQLLIVSLAVCTSLLTHAQTATLKEAYIPLPGGGKALYGANGKVSYFQREDGSGNVRIISTPTQTLGSSVGVAPFGEDYDGNLPFGMLDLSFGEMGQELATAGGVAAGYGASYVTPNRRYSALQGRWLSPDPIVSSENAYVYASNAPIINVDPSGLQDGGDDDDDCDLCYWADDLGTDWSGEDGLSLSDFDFFGDAAPYIGWYGGTDALYSPGGGRLYPSLVSPDVIVTLVYNHPVDDLNALLSDLRDDLADSAVGTAQGMAHLIWRNPTEEVWHNVWRCNAQHGCIAIGIVGPASNNGFWQSVNNVVSKIGKYVPVVCGGGVFNYAGANVGPPAATAAVAKWQQADTQTGYSEGIFSEISTGEGITAGYGSQGPVGGQQEQYLFFGVGGRTGILNGNFSEFGSDSGSFGISLEGSTGRAVGGVGAYVNVTSFTSCYGLRASNQ